MANIKLLKLVTGEEIFADVEKVPNEKNDGGYYKIKNPVRIFMTPAAKPGDQPGVGFADWSPFASPLKGKTFTLQEKHVIVCLDPVDQLAQYYTSQFGSGLLTPAKPAAGGLILPS